MGFMISRFRELNFTDEIINYQGKDRPVESKPNNQKWRWRIGQIDKRKHGTYQNNFDRI